MKTVVVDWSRSVRGQIPDQEENRQGGSDMPWCMGVRSASSQGVGGAPKKVPSIIWIEGIFLMNVKGGGNINTISFRWCGAHCDGCGF